MATQDWDSAYEADPDLLDKRHEGDDTFRDLKRDVRETLSQGGHRDPNTLAVAATTENDRGRHAVGAGPDSGPHIYKSDGTTKMVEWLDTGPVVKETITLEDNAAMLLDNAVAPLITVEDGAAGRQIAKVVGGLNVAGAFGLGDIGVAGAEMTSGGSPYTLNPKTDVSSVYRVNTSGGNVSITLPSALDYGLVYVFQKVNASNRIIFFSPAATVQLGLGGRQVVAGLGSTPADTFSFNYRGPIIAIAHPESPGTSARWEFIWRHDIAVEKSVSFTICDAVSRYIVDTTSGTRTVTLNAWNTYQELAHTQIFKVATTNAITIQPDGASTVNGGALGASANFLSGSRGVLHIFRETTTPTNWWVIPTS